MIEHSNSFVVGYSVGEYKWRHVGATVRAVDCKEAQSDTGNIVEIVVCMGN